MPVPRIFKKFASKSTLRPSSGTTTVPDVLAGHEKDISSKTLVTTAVVPVFSENFTEAWAVAHKGLPKAEGTEKLLNRVGTLTIDGTMRSSVLKSFRRKCPE
jgi:hypothetical protein